MARPRKTSTTTPNTSTKKVERWATDNYAEYTREALVQATNVLRRQLLGHDPITGNSAMKGINNSPVPEYTTEQIIKFMRSPWQHERELQLISHHLENAVMPYNRILDNFTKILLYNYELRPLTTPPRDVSMIETYLGDKDKCLELLKQLNVRSQFSNVTKLVMTDGAMFTYIRRSGKYISLQQMPMGYCKITGRTDLGYTYSFDMSFFDHFGGDKLASYAPEFAKWYDEILRLRRQRKQVDPWYPMPPDKAFVFKFDDTNAAVFPPLSGVFGDAMQIYEYKTIMKARAILDTFAILYQEIPLDKNGEKPIMTAQDATAIAAAIEASLPIGAHTVASPFKPSLHTFSRPSGEKSIIPSGEKEFYGSAGVNYSQFGGDDKGLVAQKYSALSDYAYVRHLYDQYARFVNHLLSQESEEYKFQVVFHGNLYTNPDDIKTYSSDVAKGAPVSHLYAMYGYEPWQAENCLLDEQISGIKTLMTPPQSMYQPKETQSENPIGRPSKPVEELAGPSSEAMKEEAGSGAFSL